MTYSDSRDTAEGQDNIIAAKDEEIGRLMEELRTEQAIRRVACTALLECVKALEEIRRLQKG